ncbi:MAG: cyclase family protein, partial [Dehalococcoidia bacterium]|nr:cyclase family protein [Dehalococcoidia bacterium]
LKHRRNMGRWRADDEIGAINLITPQKRVAAAGLVRSGRSVSLSREFPTVPGPGNVNPAHHWMRTVAFGTGGAAMDYYGIFYHGNIATHIDALCHIWDEHGIYNGRDPDSEITFDGARFGGIEKWSDGIITRGVLIDIPRHRGEPYVTQERPVHGWELEDAAKAQGVTVEPGDALAVYCGREAWQDVHPDTPYATMRFSRFLPSLLTGQRRGGADLGHDGRQPPWVRCSLHRPRGNLCLRSGAPGQRFAATPGRGLRRGGAVRVHANGQPPQGGWRHGVSRQPRRLVLAKDRD